MEYMWTAVECTQMVVECMQMVAVGTYVDGDRFTQKKLRKDVDHSEYVWRQCRQHAWDYVGGTIGITEPC
jgi:hypothetical protein